MDISGLSISGSSAGVGGGGGGSGRVLPSGGRRASRGSAAGAAARSLDPAGSRAAPSLTRGGSSSSSRSAGSGKGSGRGGSSVFATAGRSMAAAPAATAGTVRRPPSGSGAGGRKKPVLVRQPSGGPVPAAAPGEAPSASAPPTPREPLEGFVERKRTSVQRAKYWSPEVENAFRLQQMGWRDIDEYVTRYGRPEVWPDNGFYSMLISKETGMFTYWRRDRECADKYVNRVKVFAYDADSGPAPVAELGAYGK